MLDNIKYKLCHMTLIRSEAAAELMERDFATLPLYLHKLQTNWIPNLTTLLVASLSTLTNLKSIRLTLDSSFE